MMCTYTYPHLERNIDVYRERHRQRYIYTHTRRYRKKTERKDIRHIYICIERVARERGERERERERDERER